MCLLMFTVCRLYFDNEGLHILANDKLIHRLLNSALQSLEPGEVGILTQGEMYNLLNIKK